MHDITYYAHLTLYGAKPSVATNLTSKSLDPADETWTRMKVLSSSVRGIRRTCVSVISS